MHSGSIAPTAFDFQPFFLRRTHVKYEFLYEFLYEFYVVNKLIFSS